jgi:hypothetical protein
LAQGVDVISTFATDRELQGSKHMYMSLYGIYGIFGIFGIFGNFGIFGIFGSLHFDIIFVTNGFCGISLFYGILGHFIVFMAFRAFQCF